MKNIYFLFIVLNTFNFYGQMYNRAWGTLLPIEQIIVPKTPPQPPILYDTIYPYNSNIIAHVDLKTNNLYHLKYNLVDIYKTNTTSPNSTLLYSIPATGQGSIIQFIKTTSKGELIICGRTHVSGLATQGAYMVAPLFSSFTGSGFIAKISSTGNVLWFTYFHPIVQNASSITIDKNDNIYVLNNRDITETLSPNTFQSTGDPLMPLPHMNAITKLNANGTHLWSTFYGKDQSKIVSIAAGTNGIFVYGDHLDSKSTSNYFGTVGSYQQFATGLTTGIGNNANTTFLSKFNFDGTRAWSTYFGQDRSYSTFSSLLVNSSNLVVINDDAYLLTNHEIRPGITKNLSTKGVFLENTISNSQIDLTLTKFSGNGSRSWTTFLRTGENLLTNNNELFISSNIKSTNSFLSQLSTTNAYQKNHGGLDDTYVYTLSTDGKKMDYGSFYGFNGTEGAVYFPTAKGFFCIGFTHNNSSADASNTFATPNAPLKEYVSDTTKTKINVGNFLSYFTTESVSDKKISTLNVSVYPNPVSNILTIQSKEYLPDNTSFTIYDAAGKKVITQNAKNTNLNEINVSNLSSGIYILNINHLDINQSIKFIKK